MCSRVETQMYTLKKYMPYRHASLPRLENMISVQRDSQEFASGKIFITFKLEIIK